MLVLDGLANADGHRFQIAPGQTAVGVQPLEDDDPVAQLFKQLLIVDGQPAADVDQVVLLAAHPRPVGVVAKLLQDGGDGLVGVPLFALLDEQGVLDGARGVQIELQSVVIAEGAQLADVGHADRLAAGHVDRGRETDVGYAVSSVGVDDSPQLVEVDVALERVEVVGIVGLIDDDVDEDAAGQLLVQARRREVHVAGHVLAGLDDGTADQVFRAAPLVGGDQVAVAVDALHRLFQVVEVAAAGVGLVAQHHARPLAVAHGAGAAVGQQVNVDVVGAEQEGVEAGFGQGALAAGAVNDVERLDHFDLPRFGPGAASVLLAHCLRYVIGHTSPLRGS